MALGHCGEDEVPSFTGTTKRQRELNRFYDVTRRALLGSPHWNFATFTQPLARLAATPADPRFKYQYQLPTDPKYLKANFVHEDRNYKLSGGVLLSGAPKVTLEYQADVGESVMTDSFVELFAYRLALKIVMPLTKNIKIRATIREDFQSSAVGAQWQDASSDPNEDVIDSPFVSVRQ